MEGHQSAVWSLHDIAIANFVCCMAYKGGVGWGGIYCRVVVQQYYNRVGFAGGGDNKHMIDSHNKALE